MTRGVTAAWTGSVGLGVGGTDPSSVSVLFNEVAWTMGVGTPFVASLAINFMCGSEINSCNNKGK